MQISVPAFFWYYKKIHSFAFCWNKFLMSFRLKKSPYYSKSWILQAYDFPQNRSIISLCNSYELFIYMNFHCRSHSHCRHSITDYRHSQPAFSYVLFRSLCHRLKLYSMVVQWNAIAMTVLNIFLS